MPENSITFDNFVFDARPDTLDFRDRMYTPTLVEVPVHIDLEAYKQFKTPILNQGTEGACTGFGLATVANYLLRKRKVVPDETPVSPRMLYEMARRYDEWPSENNKGSSARGAMKGWHKHGICSAELWPYLPDMPDTALNHARVVDAAMRPLGSYYRVNHQDLVAMHSALVEAGILFASAWVHAGWMTPDEKGLIPYERDYPIRGGHAFAIVAYDEHGFWVQNSWGETWGQGGFAQVTYDDWLANGLDIWVARLGVPVSLRFAETTASRIVPGARDSSSYSFFELHPHVVTIANDGSLNTEGTYATSEVEVAEIFRPNNGDIARLTKDWPQKRLLVFAPGGLVNMDTFLQRVSEYRSAFLDAQVYPLMIGWNMDFWTVISGVLQEAFRSRRPDGTMSSKLDFMLDRLDDTIEPLVRSMMGKAQWDDVKKKAYLATIYSQGGGRRILKHLAGWFKRTPNAEVHLVGHSAGSLFLAPLVKLLTTAGIIPEGIMRGISGYGIPVTTCTLWAPAIRVDDFKLTYLPAIQSGGIKHFALYTLFDQYEQDDNVAKIYNKSLLYLISNALEGQRGQPLIGLEKLALADAEIKQLFDAHLGEWVHAPNNISKDSRWASTAGHHGDFDDDVPTLRSTMARILQRGEELPTFDFKSSEASLRDKRIALDDLTNS